MAIVVDNDLKTLAGIIGVVKFDCLSGDDEKRYQQAGIPVKTGLAGALCPDHFFITNVEACVQWGRKKGLDLLISESAGLCNRCSPHIRNVLAVCVVDNLSGVNTPRKIGPMLKTADVVVVTAPLTPESRGMLGSAQLALMKPSAYLIVISRGGIVDERALAGMLKEGHLAGAGLDVQEQEPLPPESELWDAPNLILTPHAGGTSPQSRVLATAIFRDNLARFLAGEP